MVFKQSHQFRTAHLIPHFGTSDLFSTFCHQRVGIEREGICRQLIIVGMLALIGAVGLAAFTWLSDPDFGQHVGIVGFSYPAKAVLIDPTSASEHHELCVCH